MLAQFRSAYLAGKAQFGSGYASETGTAPTITTASLPDGIAGTAYSQQLTATGTTPITWSKTAGDGAVSSTGLVTMASPTPAVYSITVKAANGTAPDDTKTFSITVPNEGVGGDAPVVTTVTLVPNTASVQAGSTVDLTATVEDQDGNPISGLTGSIAIGAAATAAQLAPTASDGTATVRVTGVSGGSASLIVTFDGGASNACALTVAPKIIPATKAISITGPAPLVTQSDTSPRLAAPTVGSIVITGLAPTVTRQNASSVSPSTKSISIVGIPPSVAQTFGKTIIAQSGQIIVTGLAPSVVRTGRAIIAYPIGIIRITGLAPTVKQASQLLPSVERTVQIWPENRIFDVMVDQQTSDYVLDTFGRQVIEKDPDETLDYPFRWTDWLADVDDTIASFEIVTAPTLTMTKSSEVGGMVMAVISGGLSGSKLPVTCRITTAAGRIADKTVYLKIKDH